MLDLVKIQPSNSNESVASRHKRLKEVEKMVKQQSDTGLSEEDERMSLIHVLMQ